MAGLTVEMVWGAVGRLIGTPEVLPDAESPDMPTVSENQNGLIGPTLAGIGDSNNQVVLITRYGGLGDLIMMLPTVKHLRLKYPRAKFVLRTYRDYVGYIDSFFDQVVMDDMHYRTYQDSTCSQQPPNGPVVSTLESDFSFVNRGDELLHYNFQGVIERRRHMHGVRTFAEFSGVDLGSDVIPSIPNSQRVAAKRVIQIRSVGDGRDLAKSELPSHVLDDPNTYLIDRMLSPQEFIGIVGSASEFYGPDSSGLHLAVGLGVPKITGLYSEEFPPEIRSYPGVQAYTNREDFLNSF